MATDPGSSRQEAAYVDHPVAELDTVTVRFPRRPGPVLTEASLTLRAGEQVLVLGASGSGKSTLLHTLTGVVPHTVTATISGEVTVAGTRSTDTSVVERSRHLGVLAQDPSAGVCLPEVEQELALPLENHAVDPAEISGRIEEALTAVHAAALRPRSTTGLSGGEGQRVALAASLVARPAVLLLDEPTSMLDPAGVAAVRAALADAVARYQPAMLLVEHRLDDFAGTHGIAALPQRAVVLNQNGEVVADGPTAAVFREHARSLHAAGCWLPLEAELSALTGADGGLANAANRELLMSLATRSTDIVPTTDRSAAGVTRGGGPVLCAAGLAVLRPGSLTPGRAAHRRRVRKPSQAEPLLTDLALDLHAGEIVAVVGANGVGKSTLLLTLAGLLPPAAGTVTGARPGMVFQNPEHQFVAHTVADEIGHGLGDERDTLILRQLRRHRLEHLAQLNPFRLSGGEKRRLSLAAMLAHARPALLLDEPTLGLDRRDTIATIAALRQAAAQGHGILFASHDLRMVTTLADRVVVLAEDTVIADGPAFDVFSDGDVLGAAGLELPALVAWLLEHAHSAAATRGVLAGLDDAVTAPSTSGTGTRAPS